MRPCFLSLIALIGHVYWNVRLREKISCALSTCNSLRQSADLDFLFEIWGHVFLTLTYHEVWTAIIGPVYWNVHVSWSRVILGLSATFIHIMEGQSILSPYPFVSFPMSVDKSFRGKNLSTVNNEDTISVYSDSSENHPLSSIRLHRLRIYFENFPSLLRIAQPFHLWNIFCVCS